MNKAAYILDGFTIYWSPLIIVLAVAAGILLALSLVTFRKKGTFAFLVMLPPAIVFSFIFSRLIHWYCCTDRYEGLGQAFSDFSVGGFSIIGVFVGCFFAACIVRGIGLTSDLPGFLDCLAPAAALSIGIGRLSFLFNSADRGKILIENEAFQSLPVGSAVVNTTSGAVQWRFATFFFQSIAAFVICAVTLAILLFFTFRKYKNGRDAGGVAAVTFAVLYFSSEIVLDSTRYDALFLRTNGFVSLMQIFSLVVLVALTALLTARVALLNGFGVKVVAGPLGVVAGLAVAGYMEYYVQRHGNLYMMCYSIMAIGLAITAAAILSLQAGTIERRVRYVPKH